MYNVQQLLSYRGEAYLRCENTYRIGPPERLFDSAGVRAMLSHLLAEVLDGHKYDAQRSARAAVYIAATAKTRLKALALPRYVSPLHTLGSRTDRTNPAAVEAKSAAFQRGWSRGVDPGGLGS